MVAHFGLECVWVVNALGEPVYRIQAPEGRCTTNVAFGSSNGQTLFITEADSATILTARLDVPGKALISRSRST